MRILPSRRTVRRWAVGLGCLVGAGLALNSFASWQTHRRFGARVAAIRAAGCPALLGDLQPSPLPSERNAAARLAALAPRLDAFAKEQWRWEETTPLGEAYADLPAGARPAPEQIAAVRAILEPYADLETAIAAAAACPRYASTADFAGDARAFLEAMIRDVGRLRTVARLVRWRAAVLVAEGRPDLAVERWIDVLRLARLHESEPCLTAQLVTYAVRAASIEGLRTALAAGPVPPELRARLDAELARADAPGKIAHALNSERAFSISMASSLFSSPCGPSGCAPADGGPADGPADGGLARRALLRLFGWVPLRRHSLGVFDAYDAMLALADRPWPDAKTAFAPGGPLATPSQHGVLADLLSPAVEQFFVAAHRDTALVRALRIQNALQGCAAEQGREAAGLDDLGLPRDAASDPFSGGTLIVRPAEGGWLVYSAGPDGIDDGGRIDGPKPADLGLGPQPAEAPRGAGAEEAGAASGEAAPSS